MPDFNTNEEGVVVKKEPPETPDPVKPPAPKTIRVRRVRSRVGKGHDIFVDVEDGLKAFKVPKGRLKSDLGLIQTLELDETVEPLYNWSREINAMIPTVAEIKHNIFLSLLRAGAETPEDLDDPRISSSVYQHAFPYRFNK